MCSLSHRTPQLARRGFQEKRNHVERTTRIARRTMSVIAWALIAMCGVVFVVVIGVVLRSLMAKPERIDSSDD